MPTRSSMSAADWLLLVFLSVLWGGSFFFAKIAVTELPPLTVALGRVGIAAAILALLVKATGNSWPHDAAAWRAFATMGVLNNVVPFSLFFWGQTHIASGLAAILNATTPLFTVIVAHLFTTDDKLTRARVAGLIAGFAGVVIMIGPDLLRDLGANVAAQIACLLGAVSYGFAGVYGRRFRDRPPLIVAGGQLTASTVMLLPMVMLIDQPWMIAAPQPITLGALLALATFSTALAYVIFFRILATAGATNLSLVTFLIPLSTILLGATFLNETLAARHIAGMAAIALGLAAIDGRAIRIFGRFRR
jgi:drug/metabolite transporter (DMT)-like permease